MNNFGLTPSEKKAHVEKYNRALFTSMARCIDTVWVLNLNQETVFFMHDTINPEMVQQNVSFEEIRSKIYAETHPDYRDAVLVVFRPQYLRNLTDSISIETRSMIRGTYHQMRCTITPSFDSHGEVTQAYLTIQDLQPIIDGRKTTENAQPDLSRLYSGLNCGIILSTRDSHRLLYVNHKALSILGYDSMSEMQADGFDGVSGCVVPEDRRHLKDLIAKLQSDDDFNDYEYRVVHRDGSRHICQSRARMISDGAYIEPLILRSIIDITQGVEDHNRFEQAASESRVKSAYLSSLGHDLRTPLDAIIGYTELARTHLADSDRAFEYLNKIDISSRKLQQMISSVLDVSQFQSETVAAITIEESENSLTEFMDTLESLTRGKALSKGISLEFNTDTLLFDTVQFDRVHLTQAFLNVMQESVRYTSPGGTVSLTLSQSAGRKSGWCECTFCFSDTGTSSRLQPMYAEMSSDSSDDLESEQNAGIGLAVARSIIEKMKGSIAISSTKDMGSSVIVKLNMPIVRKQVASDDQKTIRARVENSRILLVDDNLMNREIALVILEDTGAKVDVAENGLEAVRKVEACGSAMYDVILMDLQMPLMNGFQATRAIRAMDNPLAKSVPVIAMTASTTEEDRKRAFEAGMNAFLPKPIQIDSAFEMLSNTLKKS